MQTFLTRALAFLSIVLAASGCADDQSREREYAAGVLAAHQRLNEAYAAARPEEASPNARASREDVAALAEAARTARRDVNALEPPEELRDSHERITAALTRIERGTTLLVAASRRGPGEGEAAQRESREGLEEYLGGTVALELELDELRAAR